MHISSLAKIDALWQHHTHPHTETVFAAELSMVFATHYLPITPLSHLQHRIALTRPMVVIPMISLARPMVIMPVVMRMIGRAMKMQRALRAVLILAITVITAMYGRPWTPPCAWADELVHAGQAEVSVPQHEMVGDDYSDEFVKELANMSLIELLDLNIEAASRKLESLIIAPASVSVLKADDIRLSGARTIPELLRSVPGVQVVRNGPQNYIVALHGLAGVEGNNIVVLLDDIVLNSALDASVDWAAIPVDVSDIRQIEIVRGPVSAVYGSNAYTGIIMIHTRHGPDGDGVAMRTGIRTAMDDSGDMSGETYAAYEATNAAITTVVRVYAGWDNTLRTAHERPNRPNNGPSDGQDIGQVGGGPDGNPTEQIGARRAGGNVLISTRLSAVTKLEVHAVAGYSKRAALDRLAIEAVSRRDLFSAAVVALNIRPPSPIVEAITVRAEARGLSTTAEAAAADANADPGGANAGADTHLEVDADPGEYPDDLRVIDADVHAQVSLHPAARVQLTAGVEVGLSRATAPFLRRDANGDIHGSAAARLDVRWRLGALHLSGAGRIDTAPFLPRPAPSYRASLVYEGRAMAVRASVGTAFRNPTYLELAGCFVDSERELVFLEGRGGLRAPRITAAELAAAVSLGEVLLLRPTVFLARANDLIVGDFTSVTYKSFRNSDSPSTMLGADVELHSQPLAGLEIDAALAALHFLDEPDDPAATVGNSAYNANLTARLQARYRAGERLRLAAGTTYMSPRSFNTRAGIPPRLVAVDTGRIVQVDGAIEWQLHPTMPLWLQWKLQGQVRGDIESPLPGAAGLGTTAQLALEYRPWPRLF